MKKESSNSGKVLFTIDFFHQIKIEGKLKRIIFEYWEFNDNYELCVYKKYDEINDTITPRYINHYRYKFDFFEEIIRSFFEKIEEDLCFLLITKNISSSSRI